MKLVIYTIPHEKGIWIKELSEKKSNSFGVAFPPVSASHFVSIVAPVNILFHFSKKSKHLDFGLPSFGALCGL